MKVTNEDVASLLDEAVELMNDEGAHWVRGSFKTPLPGSDDEYAYCALGALMEVSARRAGRNQVWLTIRRRATEALAAELPESVPPRGIAEDKIVWWNDGPGTTWPIVRESFERAAEKLRDQ